MARKKVLYIVHAHPSIRRGGAEQHALEVFEAMRGSQEFEPLLLARRGPPHTTDVEREGTRVSLVDGDTDQLLFTTDATRYDWLFGLLPSKVPVTKYYPDLLRTHQPDVVHFHHTAHLGYDMIRATRKVLPETAIVYTLHEYLPICHRDGQMVRTIEDELCMHGSPRRCHECFPSIQPHEFHLRKRIVQAHFDEVDLFIAPSRFLMGRYLDWGIAAGKIVHEDYGRPPRAALAEEENPRKRSRLGFFGQFSHYKGVSVLLKAMTILHDRVPEARARLHGANLESTPEEFQREFGDLLEQTGDSVILLGRYRHEEISHLMSQVDWVVVPSRWWENSPLVIQEAFAHRRPVITSNIGGMAEKVIDGVSGLHFQVGDPASLAKVIERGIREPGLWDKLESGIPAVYSMEEHMQKLEALYRELIGQRASKQGSPVVNASG